MSDSSDLKHRTAQIVRLLAKTYADVTCALNFKNPLELLVATILSAQCTDKRVNLVTADLFRKYHTAADYVRASRAELERDIQSTGFFRNKAKNIQGCCALLAEKFNSEVPRDLESLIELPGVGRKTANVVLGTVYKIASGVVVDTHVTRISRRLGLTAEKDPVRIERDLMAVLPKKEWIDFSHRIIWHGRKICIARKPLCSQCPLLSVCPQVGVTVSE